MRINFLKRGISVLTAMAMGLSVFTGMGTSTAFAAGEKAAVYLVSFPRDGDENYGAVWGHDSLQYMNGWTSGAARVTTVRAVDTFEGNIAYCIEPGLPLETGDTFTKWDESFWDSYPSSYNKTIEPYEIRQFIGRIMQYGYTGTVSTSWLSQNQSSDKLANAVATQLLIWETVVGERDSDFNKVSTGGKDAVLAQINANHPLRSRIMNYYDTIAENVQNHAKLPSFMNKSTAKAQNIELTWNGSQYTALLTDTNNVLDDYSFSASESGISLSVSGNKLTVTTKTAPTDTVTITASKKNSQRRGIITWTDGKIGLNGGMQDTVTYSQSVNDPVKGYVNLEIKTGNMKLIKTSEDGKVEGISFTIVGEGFNVTKTTGAGGVIDISDLNPGMYTVTEQSIDKYEPQKSQQVTIISGQTATVTFNNTLKKGDLNVTKTSEDGLVQGVKFHLYGTSTSGLPVNAYAITDSSGTATFSDVLPGSGYTLEEVDTAIRYVVPDNQTVDIEWNKVTEKSFDNILKKFKVTVTKSDVETGTPQGDASLAGAVYGIYKGNQLIDTYTTDENGQFTTAYYVCGEDWSIREITASEGYLLDSTIHKVGASAKLYTLELNSTANAVTEQVIKSNMALIKHSDNGDTQIETPEDGAVFEVYLKSAGSYAKAKNSEKDLLTCDENGFAQSKDLPYGVYTVRQTKGWDGRELMRPFDVFISQDGATYRYLINNANFEAYIKIIKVDAETGKTIPYAGAGFQIYDPDGKLVEMTFTYPEITTIDTFYTNVDGYLVTPEKLPYGKGYSLVEVEAPHGYVLSKDPVYFDITEANSEKETVVTLIAVEKPNMAQKSIIKITKSGEVFSSVTVIGGGYMDENGEDIAFPNIYQPVYTAKGLAGAVYEITAAEDIYTLDGTLRTAKGEVVDTITTGENGLAVTKELYLGKYNIREITAPYGMTLNTEIRTAELIYAGQEISVTETAASFYNERQRVEISLLKTMKSDEKFSIGTNGEVCDVTFGIFAAKDLTAADGAVIPADGLIEILSCDENGNAVFKTDLPFGSYYVKELSTNAAYIPSEAKYPLQFEYAGQDTALVSIAVNDGNAIENDLIRGEIKGIKITEDGNTLGGAVIGLFKADEIEFTTENAILTAISGEDGSYQEKLVESDDEEDDFSYDSEDCEEDDYAYDPDDYEQDDEPEQDEYDEADPFYYSDQMHF